MSDIQFIRKLASVERGRRTVEALDSAGSPTQSTLLEKAASVQDKELLHIASRFEGDTLELYEAFGGKYRYTR